VESRLQQAITGPSRASVTSAVSSFIEGIGVPVAIGLIARVWHLPAIYMAGAIQLVAIAAWIRSVRGDFTESLY